MKRRTRMTALETVVSNALDAAYCQVLGLGQQEQKVAISADSYVKNRGGQQENAINLLVRKHVVMAGVAGAATSIGGFTWAPITYPTNIACVIYLQLRLIAMIAHIRGWDVRRQEVKALCLACLAGISAKEVGSVVALGVRCETMHSIIMSLPEKLLTDLVQSLRIRCVTRIGTSKFAICCKMMPAVGAILSGCVDAYSTADIATNARALFVENHFPKFTT